MMWHHVYEALCYFDMGTLYRSYPLHISEVGMTQGCNKTSVIIPSMPNLLLLSYPNLSLYLFARILVWNVSTFVSSLERRINE